MKENISEHRHYETVAEKQYINGVREKIPLFHYHFCKYNVIIATIIYLCYDISVNSYIKTKEIATCGIEIISRISYKPICFKIFILRKILIVTIRGLRVNYDTKSKKFHYFIIKGKLLRSTSYQ